MKIPQDEQGSSKPAGPGATVMLPRQEEPAPAKKPAGPGATVMLPREELLGQMQKPQEASPPASTPSPADEDAGVTSVMPRYTPPSPADEDAGITSVMPRFTPPPEGAPPPFPPPGGPGGPPPQQWGQPGGPGGPGGPPPQQWGQPGGPGGPGGPPPQQWGQPGGPGGPGGPPPQQWGQPGGPGGPGGPPPQQWGQPGGPGGPGGPPPQQWGQPGRPGGPGGPPPQQWGQQPGSGVRVYPAAGNPAEQPFLLAGLVGSLLMLISPVLPWVSYSSSFLGQTESGSSSGFAEGVGAWPLSLLGLLALAYFALRFLSSRGTALPPPIGDLIRNPMLALVPVGLGAVGLLISLLEFLDPGNVGDTNLGELEELGASFDVSASFGNYLGLLASLAVIAAGVMLFLRSRQRA